jgi:hypothetical protein
MKIEAALSKLGVEDAADVLRSHWDASLTTLPTDRPAFLEPRSIVERISWSGLDASVEPVLIDVANRVAADRELFAVAWHLYRLAWVHDDYTTRFVDWPVLRGVLGERGDIIVLLIALDIVPRLIAAHGSLGIPHRITRATLNDVIESTQRYARLHGQALGGEARAMSWFRRVARGDLYCIGRLEFTRQPFRGRIHVFEHRGDGRVAALADDGLNLDAHGYFAPANGGEPGGGFVSRFAMTPDTATGNLVSPQGFVTRREAALRLEDWRAVLRPDDPVLEIHIPAGAPLALDSVRDAKQQAQRFYARHYPDEPIAAFASYSWLFNTQLRDWLPPTSNLVAYQRSVHLFPFPGTGGDGLLFMFDKVEIDPSAELGDTRLRRAVIDHLMCGGSLRTGGMFVLPHHVDGLGAKGSGVRDQGSG